MRNLILLLTLPPMGFVSLLIVALCLRGSYQRLGRRLAWVSAIGLLVLAMPAVSGTMLRALESDLPTKPPADDPPKAIVVLGGELILSANEPLGARPGLLTLDRLRTAAALQRKTGLPILVTGGTTQITAAPVGAVMAHSLEQDFQTPARWTEDASADTQENAVFSARILHQAGIDSVYVVTHSWHMKRALLAFSRTGIKATAAPTDLDQPIGPTLDDFVPRTSAWQTCWFALHEWIGYLWYAIHPSV